MTRYTYEDYATAMEITDQAAADQCLQDLVEEMMAITGIDVEAAKRVVRKNLGYLAGYYSNETRERVERLFDCAHPVFGKIAVHGPPTSEQALLAGIAMGRAYSGESDGEA